MRFINKFAQRSGFPIKVDLWFLYTRSVGPREIYII